MAQQALVLGGGGTLGIAWMIGLSVGLAETGVDLSKADLLVGTSAGSVVGTLLAHGMDPEQLMTLAQAGVNLLDGLDQRLTAGPGGLTEEEWVATFSRVLGDRPWPTKPLKISAVDAAAGETVIFEQTSDVPMVRAIAASCAVPDLLPPVTILGRRYVDGGVRSGTHAEQALGSERTLIIAPMGGVQYPLGHKMLALEQEQLRAAGSQVQVVLPNEATEQIFGANLMDPSRVGEAVVAGFDQARGLVDRLGPFWG